MAQTIKLKRSATQNAVPSTSSLALGELAINTYDGKLFIKKNVSGTESIVTIGEVGANSIGPTELASTAVTAGSYGSTSAIPVITIDADGRITSASTATISGLSANSVTSTEIAANAVGISELNVSDGTDGQVLTTDGNGNLAFEDQSGGAASATAFSTNIASGDGSTTAFTLSESPSAESKIIAFINGVFQNQDAYTISGTTLTFDTAPISGTNNVVVYVIGDVYSGESVLISNFSGDASTTAFTLANNPGNENNTQVYIDGVYQQKTTYSVSGTTLTFSSAPPTGTNNIEVVMLTSTTVNTPAAGSVVTASMADDSVTASKIVSSAVTTAKIADSNVTTAKIADDAVTIGKIADAALVIESEGISSNDNDTTLPTSAAVKDYVDTQVAGKDALSELSGDTDDVTEGSTNLYYTDARVGTYISGNRTYGNITTTGYIAGPATFTIDPAAVGDNTGTLVIAGNLQVDGTTTTINSTTMEVDDLNITLASGAANAAAANGAGITVDCGSDTDATFTYDGTNDEWDFNKNVNVTGRIVGTGISQFADVNIPDNNAIRFGNSQDLQIYHDGSNSIIKDAGTGGLHIRASANLQLQDADGYLYVNCIDGGNGGTTKLYNLNQEKLATTATGIDVTGTATMDGLTVDGAASNYNTIQFTSGSTSHGTIVNLGDTSDVDYGSITQFATSAGEGGRMRFIAGTTETMNLRGGKVGIGNTSPLGKLTISNAAGTNAPTTVTAANTYLQLGSDDYGPSNDGKFMIGFGYTDATNTHSPAYIGFEETSTSGDTKGNLTFYTRNVITDTAPIKRMTINAAGGLSINDDVETPLSINRTTTTTGASYMSFTNGGGNAFVGIDSSAGDRMFVGGSSANAYALTLTTESANPIVFATNNSQRMSIASDGKIDMYPSGAETTGGLRVVYNGDNNYEVARFQADGDYDAHVSFVSNGTTGYYWSAGIDYSDSGAFKISNYNLLATNNELRIGTNGDVSLGANATGAALIKGVSGNQADRNAGGYPQYTFVGNEGTGMRRVASNELAFDTSGDERVRIDSNGNVGIGYLAENPPDTLMVKNTTGSQKILMHAASETANRGVALGMTVTGTGGAAAIFGTNKDLSSVTENLIFNPDGGPILMGAVPISSSPAHVTIDGRGDADTFRLSFDYGHPTMTSRGANLDFRLGNASGSATRITTNYWSGGSGNIDISAYNRTNQILLEESGQVSFSDGYIKLGGYSYVGEDLVDNDSLHLMSDYTENIIFGQRDRANNVWTESFRIDRYGNMNAPGTIVQTVRASVANVVGTGDFDIVSVNITPKFANSDMIIHFYTQWSVITAGNDGEDWGLALYRDNTASTGLGDSQNNYFINGGGVDASDNPMSLTSYSAPQYYVRVASKTDIDTGRSSGTSQITYKIRKLVPAGTSTKTVRFGIDGWTGAGVESQRSQTVLIVQEVMPNTL